jgi:hypothetical protein
MAADATTAPEWNVGMSTGLLRLGVGAAILRWRRSLVRFTGGSDGDRLLQLLFTYFGVRDMTLGVFALLSTRPGGDVPKQVTLQGAADTIDGGLVAALVARGRLPRSRGIALVALAAGSAVSEYAGAWQLRRAVRR